MRVAEILTSLQLALSVAQSVVLVAIIPCVLRNNSSVRVLRIGIHNVESSSLAARRRRGWHSSPSLSSRSCVHCVRCTPSPPTPTPRPARAAAGRGARSALVTEEVEAATLLLPSSSSWHSTRACACCRGCASRSARRSPSSCCSSCCSATRRGRSSCPSRNAASSSRRQQRGSPGSTGRSPRRLRRVGRHAAPPVRWPSSTSPATSRVPRREGGSAPQEEEAGRRARRVPQRAFEAQEVLSSSLGSAVWRVRSSEGRRRSSTRSDERETAAEPSRAGGPAGDGRVGRVVTRVRRRIHWSLRVSTPRAGGPSGALPPPSPRSASLPPMATIRSSVVADSL